MKVGDTMMLISILSVVLAIGVATETGKCCLNLLSFADRFYVG